MSSWEDIGAYENYKVIWTYLLQENNFKVMKTPKDFTYYVHLNIQICNDELMMVSSYNWAYFF